MENQVNPYAPPKAVVSDAVGPTGAFELAPRGLRLAAVIVDTVMLILALLPVLLSLGITLDSLENPALWGQRPSGRAAGATVLLVLALIVATIILVRRNSQTIGKKIFGIKVVRSDGSRASLGRIFWLRNVVSGLPSLVKYLNYLWPYLEALLIFGAKRQCVHDKIADTIVIRA